MKLSQLLLTTSICAVVAMPAFAQAKSFAEVDTNNDGELSEAELLAAFGEAGKNNIMARNDRDGNGVVTVAEIKVSQDDEDDDDDDDEDDDDEDDDESSDEDDDDESSDEDDDEDDDDESSDEDDDSDDESSDEDDD